MLQKMFSLAGMLLLSGAAFLMTTGAVQARGGGHGGGGHGGGGHGGGFHGAGQFGGFRGGYHGGYWHGGYGRGFDFRHYYGGYYPYYGYYPNYGYHPYYGGSYSLENAYADDTPLLGDGITYDSGYQGLSPQEYQAYAQAGKVSNTPAPVQPDTTAHLAVKVPVDAEVWVEGRKTNSTGSAREFQSPPLTPGARYSYEIRARWNENGHQVDQTQQVEVTAGAHIDVTFPVRPITAQ